MRKIAIDSKLITELAIIEAGVENWDDSEGRAAIDEMHDIYSEILAEINPDNKQTKTDFGWTDGEVTVDEDGIHIIDGESFKDHYYWSELDENNLIEI